MARFEPKPFGKYFLTDRIAVGGMAEIYKAKTFGVDGFEKILAIKKILSHYSADKEFITMLTDEAKLVVNLSHANIVQVYDLGRVGDDYFISMEFIDGINLRDLIQRSRELEEPVPYDVAIHIISEVCRGLDYAHNKKDQNGKPLQIIHRDISPQNILVSFDGGVKIVDFGIAKAAMNLSETHAGILKGKVNYMAPEQAFGKPMDQRSDIFSLGLVLYELLTTKRLFVGETQMEVLKQIRNKKITEDTLDHEGIPVFLKSVLAKSLNYATNKRYAGAADFQIELTRLLYSTYNDFTPRKLNELLDKWFEGKKTKSMLDESNPDIDRETILVSSTENQIDQINLVHRDEALDLQATKAASILNVEDTINPQDDLDGAYFESPEQAEVESVIEPVERTEKSEVTQQEETLHDMLLRVETKRSKMVRRTSLWLVLLVVFLALAGYFLFDRYAKLIFPKLFEETTVSPTQIETLPAETQKTVLQILTEPAGAEVWLDGIKQEQQTPVILSDVLLFQTHQIKIQLNGYQQIEQSLLLTEDKPEPFTFTLTPLQTQVFVLHLNSEPAGALIKIDGVSVDKTTPATIADLEVGRNYKVQLELEKYKLYEDVISQDTTEDENIVVRLEPLPVAQLFINSEPEGAKIFIDGKETPYETPYSFKDLEFPLTVNILLKKENYKDVEETVKITQAEQYEINPELTEVIVEVPVMITANVTGAEVYLDDTLRGKIPAEFVLRPGNYQVVVKKQGYINEIQEVIITKADTKKKRFFFNLKSVTTEPSHTATPLTDNTSKPKDQYSAINTETTNVAATAKLRIDSNPSGASVKVDGVSKGITPIVISNLPKNKTMNISVSKKGYGVWNQSLTLSKDRTEIRANLFQ